MKTLLCYELCPFEAECLFMYASKAPLFFTIVVAYPSSYNPSKISILHENQQRWIKHMNEAVSLKLKRHSHEG